MSLSQTPAYNLKAVLKDTGIKADVLRAWERRYGLPMPQRSAGGHRLYSQRDVETIRWLMARQAEGLSISRAVETWREAETGGHDPLAESRQMTASFPMSTSLPAAGTSLDAARVEWLAACLAFNEPLAEQTLNQAFALHPLETVCIDLLQKGLVEIGSLWYENRASVQQEHFASALVMRRLDALLTAAPPPTRSQTVLVGCPPGEWHSFTALLLALFLRRRGLNVIYLGANVPAQRFEETVQIVRADLVVLAAQQLTSAAALQQTAAALTAHGLHVAYDGRIFSLQPGLQQRIAGHFLGGQLIGAAENVLALLTHRLPLTPPLMPAPQYSEALLAFLASRTSIEAALEARTTSLHIPLEHTVIANHFMGDNLTAVLRLGEMAYLDGEINWLTRFLKTQNIPLEFLYEYFNLYLDVLRQQLGERSGPLIGWFERQIATLEH